jgi:alpha-tubulin suppressor-like RCC1 family protein
MRSALLAVVATLLSACGGGSGPRAPVDADRSTLGAAPSAAVADGQQLIVVTATARDAGGGLLSGRVATFTVIDGPAHLSAASATTGADGAASVSLTSTGVGASALSVSIDGVPVTARASATFVAGPPATLRFTLQPASLAAGAPLEAALQVTDALAHPVAGATVQLALLGGPPDATLDGTTAGASDASGLVVLHGPTVTRAATGYSLLATAGGAQATSATFDVSAAAPSLTRSTVTAVPAAITAGGTPATVTVTLVDDYENRVAGAQVTLASSMPDDLLGATEATSAEGLTSCTVEATESGQRTIAASVGGLPLLQTAALVVRPGAPDPASSTITGPAGVVVADGSTAGLVTVVLRDRFGNPVPDVAVEYATTAGALGAVAVTTGLAGESGVTLTSTVAGEAVVTATFQGGALQATVGFIAGPATSLQVVGLPASVEAGTPLAVTISARDARGNLAAGYRGTIHLAATDPAAALPADLVLGAGDAGARSVPLTLATAGGQTLTVRDVDAPGLVAAATTLVTPAAAAALALTGLPDEVTAGAPFTVTVTALDPYGNAATAYRGTVALGSSDAGAVLPSSHAFADGDEGRHAFDGLELHAAGVQSVTAADTLAAGLGTTAEVLVRPGEAARLAFVVQPSDTIAGDLITPAVQVAVQDAFGNATATAARVDLAIAAGSPGGDLLGTTGQLSAAGSATFTDLSLQVAGIGYRLAASSPGLAGEASAAFSIAPSDPSSATSDVGASPVQLTAGERSDITVTVRDAHGNVIPGAAVTLAATGATNALTQPAAVTDQAGVAVGSLSSTLAETKLLTARVGATTLEAHPQVTFVAGAPDPAGSSLVASPASAPADASQISLTATIADRYGNPVSGQVVTFSASGSALFLQPEAPTDGDGRAVGTVASIDVGAQKVTATVGGVDLATADVTFTPAPPSAVTSEISAAPSSIPADGTTYASVTVDVLDRGARGLAGRRVALAFSGAASIAPASAITDAWGAAVFHVTSTTVGAGALTATVDPGEPGQVVLQQHPALAFTVPTWRISGRVFGLSTAGLTLSSPGLADLAVSAGATSFAFSQRLATGSSYAVVIKAQPTGLYCKVLGGSGVVPGGDVTGVLVDCSARWKQVAAGDGFVVGLTTDGKLYTWGSNIYGDLGDGSQVSSARPRLIGSGFTVVSAGRYHALAVNGSGDLYAWGANDQGQLGDGSLTSSPVPKLVGSGFAAVSAGFGHSLAVTTSGDLYAWGANGSGQLGDGSFTSSRIPKKVGTGFVSVAAGGSHSLAVKSGGNLYAWGNNTDGELGDGTTTTSPVPKLIGAGFAAAAAGHDHSLALTTTGALYAWGWNADGQLGLGTTTSQRSPTLVGTGFAALAAGYNHSMGVKTGGALYTWGFNGSGQLGLGSTWSSSYPVLVGPGFASAAGGNGHSLGVKTTGELFAWGANPYGGPDLLPAPRLLASGFTTVTLGGAAFALNAAGDLYAWGYNQGWLLGDGTTISPEGPELIGSGFMAIAAGQFHALALKRNGDLYAWGSNFSGQLGDGTTNTSHLPKLVGTGFTAVAAGYAHSLALRPGGDLYAWGRNTSGQLGDGTTTQSLVPKLIGSGFAAISAGDDHSLAVKVVGDLYAWGNNDRGQIGDGTQTQRSSPVLVGAGFAAVSAGYQHSLALKANGDLHAWGFNYRGQLGDGTTSNALTPRLVGAGFATISAAEYCSAGVKLNGELYAWGANDYGQLGDGSTAQATLPRLVGAGFVAAAAGQTNTLAVRSTGDLLGWGANGLNLADGHGRWSLRPSQVLVPGWLDLIAYAPTVSALPVGVAATPLIPAYVGGASAFSVAPALPAGLTLDPETGVVSGTPLAPSPTTSYLVTATGPTGTTTTLLTLTVN